MTTEIIKTELSLPQFSEPHSLDNAKRAINHLGKNLHEHAYICGKTLIWIKVKVGPGNFENWVEDNVWFGVRTARRFMRYAIECDTMQYLLEYHTNKSDTVSDLPLILPPEGTFQIIAIDPPWPYGGTYNPDTHRVASPYPEMGIEQLKGIEPYDKDGKLFFRVPSAPDCILWLWTTNAFMHDAYHLLDFWGFNSHTILTWDKQRIGVGIYLRGQTEHCILATKGKPVITHSAQSTLLSEKAKEHSRKPDSFYILVEGLCPTLGKYLDMFARKDGYTSKSEKWETWGNEA